jgi:hypothetical protein
MNRPFIYPAGTSGAVLAVSDSIVRKPPPRGTTAALGGAANRHLIGPRIINQTQGAINVNHGKDESG